MPASPAAVLDDVDETPEPTNVPPAFRASEIALVAIKQNRFTTWAELEKSGLDTRLNDDQLDLVHREMSTVSQLVVGAVGKSVTVTFCPNCGRMAFFGTGSLPAKCTLTFTCTGKPVKAAAMKRKPKPAVAALPAEPGTELGATVDPTPAAPCAAPVSDRNAPVGSLESETVAGPVDVPVTAAFTSEPSGDEHAESNFDPAAAAAFDAEEWLGADVPPEEFTFASEFVAAPAIERAAPPVAAAPAPVQASVPVTEQASVPGPVPVLNLEVPDDPNEEF